MGRLSICGNVLLLSGGENDPMCVPTELDSTNFFATPGIAYQQQPSLVPVLTTCTIGLT